MDEDKPVNRRRFFRQGLRELLKPLVEAEKWQRISALLNRYQAMEPQLRQSGLLPPAERPGVAPPGDR